MNGTAQSHERTHRPTFAYLCASLHTGASPEVWGGIQEAAEALDVNVFAMPGGRLGGREDFESLRNRAYYLPNRVNVDGILSWASSLSGIRGASDMAALHERFSGIPLVTLADPLPGYPCVRFDVLAGMRALVDHLVEVHGYKEFAFVRGPEAHLSAQARFGAFRDSLTRHGLVCRDELVTTPRGWDQGKEALAELIDHRGKIPGRDFTALVAASDLLAFSILRDLQNRGYRIPSDTAVVGFNDSPESRIANPPLTTVHLPFSQQAQVGLRRLYDLWRGETSPDDGLLETRLVLRQSCSCRSRELERAGTSPGRQSYVELGFSPQEIQAWIDPLEGALDDPIPERRDRRFLDLLERVLERVTATKFPAALWQTVLSELRRGRPKLDRAYEDLFGQARVLISEASVREYSFHQWQREQKAEEIRAFTRSLQGALDPRRLSDILSRKLPDLGFRSAYLVRKEGLAPQGRAVLLGGYTEHGRPELPPGGLVFPAAVLVPSGLLANRRRTLVVEPLFYREHSLGYLVLEAAKVESSVYEELRSAVSIALKTALLLDSGGEAPEAVRFLDPWGLFPDRERRSLLLGDDRLPLCVADPRPLIRALEARGAGAPPPQFRLDGPALQIDLAPGTSFRLPFPTLGGEPGNIEGDQLVVLTEAPVSERFLAALEEATALGSLVMDPRAVRLEAFASIRPPLCVVDLDTAGESTLQILSLLASDPGWRTVPFLVYPSRTRPLTEGRGLGLLEHLPVNRSRTQGPHILFVGTPAPAHDHPGLSFQTVGSALQAIPLLQQEPPALVVTASGGPGITGLDLVDFLRSDPPLANLPILVIAGESLRPEEWHRLEDQTQVSVQVQGIWTDEEYVHFLSELARRPPSPSIRVKKALAWLSKHATQDVSRWRMAEALAISEDHLTREFRKELGLSPWDFLARYRILLAKRALESSSLGLSEIAREVGYHDPSYFCRVFRKVTGTTPQRYRETWNRPNA